MSYENRPDSRDLPDQDIKILSSEICILIKESYREISVLEASEVRSLVCHICQIWLIAEKLDDKI